MAQDAYDLVQLSSENAPELTEFLTNHFLVEEPLNKALGTTPQKFQVFVNKLLESTLNIPFSYAFVEKDSRKIVACAMSSLWKIEREIRNKDGKKKKEIGPIRKILTELHGKFYEIHPEIEQVLHLEILSVAKQHQRRGLASKLMDKMEDVEKIKMFGCCGIASEISSLANQCLMKKRGYENVAEILLNSICDDFGHPCIITDDGTDRVVLMYKKF